MTKGKVLNALAAVAAVATLAACGQSSNASGGTAGLTTASYREAGVERAGNAITVTRTQDGNQGVYIWRSAALVTFTVEGEGARLRIRDGGRDQYRPLQETNTVLLGPGGLTRILVMSSTGQPLTVNITNVVECGADPAACEAFLPAQAPAVEEPEAAEAAPAAADAPAAATPAPAAAPAP